MADPNCPDCQGKGWVKDKDGSHTCWRCLKAGKLDAHVTEIKDTGIRW
ncbi:MAG: hypothetical protein ABH817_01055 [archaeon]